MASSIDPMETSVPPLLAVRIAASLSTFSRSAPVKYGVLRATTERSTSGPSGLLRA
jgi:hypothetical protein